MDPDKFLRLGSRVLATKLEPLGYSFEIAQEPTRGSGGIFAEGAFFTMTQALYATAFLLGCAVLAAPAWACNVDRFEPTDIDHVQVVVIGEVRNYRVVPNDAFSEQIRKGIEDGTTPEWQRKQYFEDVAKGTSPGGYYGRVDIAVKKVLKGHAGQTLSVTLDDWTIPHVGDDSSRLPKRLESKDYLLALNMPDPESRIGRSADSRLLTVYIDGCLGPFMEDPDFEAEIEQYRQWLREQRRKRSSDLGTRLN